MATVHTWVGAAILPLCLFACGDDSPEPTSTNLAFHDLARIHIVLQSQPSSVLKVPPLEITARFVQYRGLSESVVRSRVGMVPFVWEKLSLGQCISSQKLHNSYLPESGKLAPATQREVLLLDVGNMQVHFDPLRVDVPLALIPDLLPYMSGVEYRYSGEKLPDSMWAFAFPNTVSIDLEDGGEELPHLSVEMALPPPIELAASYDLQRNGIFVQWRANPTTKLPFILRFVSTQHNEHDPDEILCVVPDQGYFYVQAEQDKNFYVQASRMQVIPFSKGSFRNGEIVLELREQTEIVKPDLELEPDSEKPEFTGRK